MSEEEFEERQLTKLISDLRDINSYTDFKNGAFIYDLGHYQGLLLVNEIERLNNIITELEKYCETRLSIFEQMTDEQREEQLDKYKIYDIFLSRIKELKGDSSNE